MHSTTLSVAALCFLASAAAAQTPHPSESPERTVRDQPSLTPHYVKLGDVIGAKVLLRPTAEQAAEAARENESPKREHGEIKELLVCAGTGDARWASVSVGGMLGIGDRTVLVPSNALMWSQSDEAFALNATEDQLKQVPEFEVKKAKGDMQVAIDSAKRAWPSMVSPVDAKAIEPIARDQEGVEQHERNMRGLLRDSTMTICSDKFLLASELCDPKVRDLDGELGKFNTVIFDRNNERVAGLVLARGGVAGVGAKEYVLPFESLALCTAPGDDEKSFCVPHRRAALDEAVEFHAVDGALIAAADVQRARDWCKRHRDLDSRKLEEGARREG